MIFLSGSAIRRERVLVSYWEIWEWSIDAHFENIHTRNATHVVESPISQRRDDSGNNSASATTDTTRAEERKQERECAEINEKVV